MRTALLLLVGLVGVPAVVLPAGPEPASGPRVDWYGDPLPKGVTARLGTVRFRDASVGEAVAYSPDGSRIVTASDTALTIWDARTGQSQLALSWEPSVGGGRPPVGVGLAFAPDGKHLAYGTGARPILLLSLDTGETRPLGPADFRAGSLAFTPDGRHLVAVGPREIRVLPVAGGPSIQAGATQFAGTPNSVPFRGPFFDQAALSPDGKVLAVVGRDRRRGVPGQVEDLPRHLHLWDVATGEELVRLDLGVQQVAFRPDGKALAVDLGSAVALLDPRTGERLGGWAVADAPWCTLAFSPDGTRLTANGHLCNAATGKALWKLGLAAYLAFAPDGRELAIANFGVLTVRDARSGKIVRPLAGHDDRIYRLTALADSRTVATDDETRLRLWDAATGKPIDRPGLTGVFPGGRWGLCWVDERMEVRHLETGRLAGTVPIGEHPLWLAVSDCGRTLLYRTLYQQSVYLVDVATGRLRHQLDFKPENLLAAALSPDGALTATVDGSGAIRLWDTATGRVRTTLEPALADGFTISGSVAFSPDGRLLASSRAVDNALRLWDVTAGRPLGSGQLLAGPENEFHECMTFAFSPDGRLLITTGTDSVRVWEVASLRERFRFEGWIRSAAVAGRHLLVTGDFFERWALVRDLAGLADAANAGQPPRETTALWATLADPDPARAYRAGRALTTTPDATLALLRERLRPVEPIEPDRLRARIAALDADDFEARDQATNELARLGELAIPALTDARRTATSAEQRRRLDELLPTPVGRLHPDRLRVVRAIEVLEDIATAQARAILERLSLGEPAALETQHAIATLERLRGQP